MNYILYYKEDIITEEEEETVTIHYGRALCVTGVGSGYGYQNTNEPPLDFSIKRKTALL